MNENQIFHDFNYSRLKLVAKYNEQPDKLLHLHVRFQSSELHRMKPYYYLRSTGDIRIILVRIFFLLPFILLLLPQISHSQDSPSSVMGMMVGAGYGKLRSNDASDLEFKFKPTYTKYAGFSLEFPIQKLEKRGTFYNELTFSQFDARSSATFPDSTLGFPERDYYEVNQTFAPNILSLTNMFRYCFTNGSLKYYLSIGIYNSFIISPVNRKTTLHYRDGDTDILNEEVIPDHAVHGLMLIVGTGITYKYAGLEFRFDPGRNFTKQVDYSIYNPLLSAVLHVRFNPR